LPLKKRHISMMDPLLHIFILVAVGFVLIQIARFVKSQHEAIGYIYRKQFKLKHIEKEHLNAYTKKIKRNFASTFCIEIFIGLYIEIVREIPRKQQKDNTLSSRLIDVCIAIVKKKCNLILPFDISVYKALFPDDIYNIIKDKEQSIRALTETEEQELFKHDKKRMKRIYDGLVSKLDKNHPNIFYDDICKLGLYCRTIGAIHSRSLYYKSHNLMVDYDRKYALKLYLHYLSIKSTSETFKYKEITKRNTSELFDTEEQKKKFALICAQFREKQDIAWACEQVDELYIHVRRKIKLQIESIKDAKSQHNEVAQMLGTYLNEEETLSEVSSLEKFSKKTTEYPSENKKELFDLFILRSFRLNRQEVNIFATSKGLFRDNFIESINEEYYETLDDLLIEVEGDDYIMNEDYYQQIK